MTFCNEIAISSRWQALKLIVRGWNDRTVRRLHVRGGGVEPHIEIAFFGGAYDSHSRSDYYRVTREVVSWLQDHGFVIGSPYYGGRYEHQFEATELAEERRWGGFGVIVRPNADRAVVFRSWRAEGTKGDG